jgi:hypothetical protein
LEERDRPDGADRRLKLNVIQVAAGALAAISSAVAASFFGVGGTIVGAAVSSIVTTTAGTVYSYYLGRTQNRLRVFVTPVAEKAKAGQWPVPLPRTVVGTTAPDAAEGTADVPSEAAESREAAAETTATAGTQISWRRWAPAGALAVLVFVVAMGSITLFEWGTGQPVAATVQGKSGSGTSLGKAKVTSEKSTPDTWQQRTPSSDSPSGPTSEPSSSPEPSQSTSDTPSPPEPPEQPSAQPTDQTGAPG